MNVIIVEDGEVVGHISDDGGYEWSYTGNDDGLRRSLESLEEAETYDATSGPGGNTHERRTEADADEKAERAVAAVESSRTATTEPAPPTTAEKALDFLEELL